MASTMKAWRTYKYNEDVPAAIGALKLETDVPVPTPGAGEVRVKVLHAAVNPIDWKLFSGGYHSMCPATFPYVPGFDLSGTVEAVGLRRRAFSVRQGPRRALQVADGAVGRQARHRRGLDGIH